MATLKKSSMVMAVAALTVLGAGGTAQAIIAQDESVDILVDPFDFSGVAFLLLGSEASCTGSLLTGGLHILTAAHCLTDQNGQLISSLVGNTTAIFNLSNDPLFDPSITPVDAEIAVSEFFIFPGWTGAGINNEGFFRGDDIAVLKLAEPAPMGIEQYDIYRDRDEVSQIFTVVGYGNTGTGAEGQDPLSVDGRKRFGENRFDALIDIFPFEVIPGSQLLFDFDNGTAANDAFGFFFGELYPDLIDTGLEPIRREVNIAQGDSGGPSFLGNLIAGVTSYGYSPGISPPDIDNELNFSFGEFASVTRVSNYASFVDNAIAGKAHSAISVPEPSSILGTIVFGAWGASTLLKRKDKT